MNKVNLQIENDSDSDDLFGFGSIFDLSRNTSDQAEPLVRRDDINFPKDIFEGKWRPQPAALYLLPFHSFADQLELTITLPVQRSQTKLKQLWSVFYVREDDGSSESYAAEMLVFKRKLYEQTNAETAGELLDRVRITSGDDFILFTDNFSDEERCIALLKKTLMSNAHNQLLETGGKQKTISEKLLRRCEEYSCDSESDKETGKVSTEINVILTDYWLDWFEAASAVSFDFEYPAQLDPLSMRCYELIKLLFYDRNVLPLRNTADGKSQPDSREENREVATLKINYELFAKLMPIPVLEESAAIKTQIENLCRAHIEKGFLKNIRFEKDEIIFTLVEV